jgi:[ribosomal protein S5]-alanine N-acetyltransferase
MGARRHLCICPIRGPSARSPVILRTPRLILRELVAEDWQATYAYQQDARYLRFYDRDGVTPRLVQAFVYTCITWQGEEPRVRAQLAITLAETGELIGNVGVRREKPGDLMADMGYELAPEHWGRGYATEAARAMVDWGFGDCGLERIHAHCIADNEASARVLHKVGLRQEARLRDHQWFKGRFWDVVLFGMMRGEWTPPAQRGSEG